MKNMRAPRAFELIANNCSTSRRSGPDTAGGKSRSAAAIYRSISITRGIFSFQLALLGLINFSPLPRVEIRGQRGTRGPAEIFRTAACIAPLDVSLFAITPLLHAEYEYTEAHLIFLARSGYEYRYRCCNRNAARDNVIHSLPPLSN